MSKKVFISKMFNNNDNNNNVQCDVSVFQDMHHSVGKRITIL